MIAKLAERLELPFEISPGQIQRADFYLVSNHMLLNLFGLYGPQTLSQIKGRLPLASWTRAHTDFLRTQLGALRRDVQTAWGTGYVIMTNMKTAAGRSETHYKLTPGAHRQWLDNTMPGLALSEDDKTLLRNGEFLS